PQERAHVAAAEMVATAADISFRNDGPAILAPSLSDLSEKWLTGRWGDGTPRDVFARQFLRELRGWAPSGSVGWSQHSYGDFGRAETDGLERSLELLDGHGWHDASNGIWLTEGGV